MNPFGLVIHWAMAQHDGGVNGSGVCIGQMDWSDSVWVIANADEVGTVVNREWCSWRGTERDDKVAMRLRRRYIAEMGQRLKVFDL